MFRHLIGFARLAGAYFVFNLHSQLEYRGAFISQALAMFVNNAVWLGFWSLFFHRFPVLSGWSISDVVTLWALAAAGFGLAYTLCGNALQIAAIIARGQLDTWLTYPRAVLPHLLLGRMSATAVGDALFGYLVYLLLVRPDMEHFLLFAGLTVSVALVFLGFCVMAGSLGFFVGNAEALSEQWFFAMITFSTYPSTLFDGAARLVLYTLIPAFYVSHYPVSALRKLSLVDAGIAVAGSLFVLSLGALVFLCRPAPLRVGEPD